ncbi:MAG: LysM peptidoglycan-binding domain-containing protein [Planctomycetes bacterium]|nr:LysM peptidoglycan-binding domain-containing protein [Planctomycetota bacterium]
MIHGGIPKTRIAHRKNDSKKGGLLFLTLVMLCVGGLMIVLFSGGEEGEDVVLDNSNSINLPSSDTMDSFSDLATNDSETIGASDVTSSDEPEEGESDAPDFFEHKIKSGENFTVLAKKYYNDTRKTHVIVKANPNVNPKKLQIGQKIIVPNLNKKKATEESAHSNTSSVNSTSGSNNGVDLKAWKEFNNKNENKKSSGEKKNHPFHPFGRQEQPEVPDDENVGSLVKVVIREKTTHYASQGDSSIGLALQYYGSYKLKSLIEKANPGIDWYNLKGGEKIIIPEYSEEKVRSPKPEKDLSQKRDETSGDPVIEEEKPSKPSENADYEMYTVQKDESLWVIAKKKLGNGIRYKEIMKLNNMTSDVVNEGMRIKIPKR